MDGYITVIYKILCESDFNSAISLNTLLSNEKVLKVIKSEYAKGQRNISLTSKDDIELHIETNKELFSFEVSKNDFADILTLAEDDANNKKLLKKECLRVELVDIQTN